MFKLSIFEFPIEPINILVNITKSKAFFTRHVCHVNRLKEYFLN